MNEYCRVYVNGEKVGDQSAPCVYRFLVLTSSVYDLGR